MSELSALMRQVITIETPSGFAQSGEPTFNDPVTYRCQLTGKRKMTVNANGETVMSGMTAIFESGDPFDTRSRVTLATGDIGSTESHLITPAIASVHRFSDDGFELVELLLAGGRSVRSA